MKNHHSRLDNLARISMRLNKGMIALLGLALLLMTFGLWSIQRLVDEHSHTVNIHFARLMENIREQEYFLRTLVRQSVEGELLKRHRPLDVELTPLPEVGPEIFQGQAFPFTLPFSVKLDLERVDSSEMPRIFSQGANLAAFYSSFWSAAHYRSPQIFIFSPSMHYDIAVPAAGRGRGQTVSGNEPFADVIGRVVTRLPEKGAWPHDDTVIWRSYVPHPDHTSPMRLLAYASAPTGPKPASAARYRVASLVDLAQINDFERIMARTVYDRFTLIAPSGRVLIGDALPLVDIHEGLNFKADGLVFYLKEHAGRGWSAVYTVTYQHFFRYAFWSLVSLAVIFFVILGLGRLATRWYQHRVIRPARDAQLTIAESEAFSRAVIDTAPTGLCVVRNADHAVLLENQCAQQWHGTGELIKTLAPQFHKTCSGEDHVQIDGRHFKVGFISTRYHGEDVKLLAFNDITGHIEDAQALEDARRAADTANQAKTLFLATMSHEIRTPLYGVLGTLELLGLTQLNNRQRDYLHTIQRSSATLFQLISDVLDVTKIESGQMTLEPVAFSPLDMLEDTLRTYCAFAERKGLLLYACTDARLPAQLVGDPIRIRQILNNLLSNAIKFTDTGRVVLRTRVLAIDATQVSLEWQVTDSGIGISKAQQARLFELFYQVKDATNEGGAGLGLPICGWLADMMSGQIKVVSEPGLGSSFSLKVNLPLAQGVLSNCPTREPDPTPVYIRAPIPELAQNCVDWLQRLGIAATLTIPPHEHDNAQAILVEVLNCANAEPWAGQRIYASSDGPAPGGFKGDHWSVNMHDVRALARVIDHARHGETTDSHVIAQQQCAALRLHVLVAEDNPINQAILKEQLEALGCSAVVAANGEQAMQRWQPGTFDAVLTDVSMPVMNGYELAKTLRQLDTEISIIGVTANALSEEGQRCLEAGMNAWMVKPLSLQALRTHLARLCRTTSLSDRHGDEHDFTNARPPASQADIMQLSPTMRRLFIDTMQDDIKHILIALEQRDSQRLAELLHSIAGALGAVQALALAEKCCALENVLLGAQIDATMVERVDGVVASLAAIIASLE